MDHYFYKTKKMFARHPIAPSVPNIVTDAHGELEAILYPQEIWYKPQQNTT